MKIIFFSVILCISQIANADSLSWNGWGNVKFGMHINSDYKSDSTAIFGSESCQYMINEKYPNIKFMVENGIINRVDVPIKSKTEIGINGLQTIEEMKAIFPSIEFNQHKYAKDGYDLYFYNEDKTKAIVIEFYKGKSQRMRAGNFPAVGYVEGCG